MSRTTLVRLVKLPSAMVKVTAVGPWLSTVVVSLTSGETLPARSRKTTATRRSPSPAGSRLTVLAGANGSGVSLSTVPSGATTIWAAPTALSMRFTVCEVL
jgi:hypothetical protein